jgi:hypothetical protein
MGVGGIRRGGGKGRAGGSNGASRAGPTPKTGRKTFNGKVDKSKPVESASPSAASGRLGAIDPLSTHALDLARKLKNGEIATRAEATKQLVCDILEEKLRIESKALASTIADALLDDPRLKLALERLWSRED